LYALLFFFFFQAEDGIRDYKVTGVQTCALAISGARGGWRAGGRTRHPPRAPGVGGGSSAPPGASLRRARASWAPRRADRRRASQIGRASCRERGETSGGGVGVG